MRKIGTIEDEQRAALFHDYLFANGIENEINSSSEDGWDVWGLDEAHIDAAKRELDAFLADPGAETYQSTKGAAAEHQRKESEERAEFQKKVYDRKRILKRSLWSAVPVTMALIVISVVVTLVAGLGSGSPITKWLSIAHYEMTETGIAWDETLPAIRHGQVWRLITPIFIHASVTLPPFGLFHILFNMLWLKDLGGMLERAQGKKGLLTKVLVIGVLSNLGQCALAGPTFGGMSGVVFGLLGYCWMRGRFDVTSGLFVHSQTVMFMGVWFFLCLFGAMGSIANGAHGVGLVVGTAWGYFSAHTANARA